jgi:sugar lactone lactonase YvrE
MKSLICPQCGGKLTDYSPLQNFATCGYCATKIVIEQQKPASQTIPVNQPVKTFSLSFNILVSLIVGGCVVVGAIFLIAILADKKESKPTLPVYNPPPFAAPTPRVSPTPTPNPNLLEFGGKGTGDGLFQDANKIAVDKQGRIYVADETLRVQQFNEKGEFLKVWQIPTETQYYKRARSIRKIGINNNDQLYVLVGGLILVYENASSKFSKIIHFEPNPIQDFAFRSDGDRLFLINNGEIEYFVQVDETGKSPRRVNSFHTNAANASMSPSATGLAAIRLAVDGAGNIYSIYALGDIGSYQLSYNEEDFRIFRFTPEGKYVNKFAQTMNSCGIALDNQSRIYVSDNKLIRVFSGNGEQVSNFYGDGNIDSFALDKENNIYILNDDKVIIRPAIQ